MERAETTASGTGTARSVRTAIRMADAVPEFAVIIAWANGTATPLARSAPPMDGALAVITRRAALRVRGMDGISLSCFTPSKYLSRAQPRPMWWGMCILPRRCVFTRYRVPHCWPRLSDLLLNDCSRHSRNASFFLWSVSWRVLIGFVGEIPRCGTECVSDGNCADGTDGCVYCSFGLCSDSTLQRDECVEQNSSD